FTADEVAGHVLITPPQWGGSSLLKSLTRSRTAMITGWALDRNTIHRHHCDAAFALSDHADFADLLSYVERVNPKKVLTLHGFAEDFARTLRERGIEAWALGRGNQLDLGLAP
ncbi:MAG TPA: MBL fold metallo-hydrolase RNA specificity domain-containing protein, partial [Roseimicrobium sp.]|nr:MBL fold metallo-hydrolase RNA specificity domain-containing protein [Roseimicrobium sp.]